MPERMSSRERTSGEFISREERKEQRRIEREYRKNINLVKKKREIFYKGCRLPKDGDYGHLRVREPDQFDERTYWRKDIKKYKGIPLPEGSLITKGLPKGSFKGLSESQIREMTKKGKRKYLQYAKTKGIKPLTQNILIKKEYVDVFCGEGDILPIKEE